MKLDAVQLDLTRVHYGTIPEVFLELTVEKTPNSLPNSDCLIQRNKIYLVRSISEAASSLNRQPYGTKVLCVQRDLMFGNSGSYPMLKIVSRVRGSVTNNNRFWIG
jgi:hypothetical protein